MKALFTYLCRRPIKSYSLAFLFVIALLGWGAPAAKAQTWMVSTTPYIKLGVLDKYHSLDGYQAVFIVTSERDHQEYMLVKTVAKTEQGVDVLFPSEPTDPEYFKNPKGLAAQPVAGSYTWECRVQGKRVVGGHFTYPDAGNDINTIVRQ
ncbi:hypothetical protein HHL22_07585 [Hymenobacter sp. RP-2-7]|uniref:Uncharacterized protein n=1 Tax=Hymenobacter polaris TaxID=2682546 RepID=A0A7Y0ACZ7_9BACT|nr:hypothetical protein [Hymenobacter polaris]NML65065.1 hypothetical protein [Hymenobacter polaris]